LEEKWKFEDLELAPSLPGYPVIFAVIARSTPHAVVLRVKENGIDGA